MDHQSWHAVGRSTWHNAQTMTTDADTPQTVDLDKSSWGAETVFQVRFRYTGENAGYWKVDNISIEWE